MSVFMCIVLERFSTIKGCTKSRRHNSPICVRNPLRHISGKTRTSGVFWLCDGTCCSFAEGAVHTRCSCGFPFMRSGSWSIVGIIAASATSLAAAATAPMAGTSAMAAVEVQLPQSLPFFKMKGSRGMSSNCSNKYGGDLHKYHLLLRVLKID